MADEPVTHKELDQFRKDLNSTIADIIKQMDADRKNFDKELGDSLVVVNKAINDTNNDLKDTVKDVADLDKRVTALEKKK